MDLLLVILDLVFIDLILGGDNAIVISLATKNLPQNIKMKASIYGALAAIALRIVFIGIVIFFGEKHIILLNLFAGLLLIKVAIDMLNPEEEEHDVKSGSTLMSAVKTILIADAVMSFDNAIVIASIVEKANVSPTMELILIVSALLFSFPIILFGAQLLSKIIEKFKVIIYIFVLVLIHIGMELISKDPLFASVSLPEFAMSSLVWILAIVIFICGYIYQTNKKKA